MNAIKTGQNPSINNRDVFFFSIFFKFFFFSSCLSLIFCSDCVQLEKVELNQQHCDCCANCTILGKFEKCFIKLFNMPILPIWMIRSKWFASSLVIWFMNCFTHFTFHISPQRKGRQNVNTHHVYRFRTKKKVDNNFCTFVRSANNFIN